MKVLKIITFLLISWMGYYWLYCKLVSSTWRQHILYASCFSLVKAIKDIESFELLIFISLESYIKVIWLRRTRNRYPELGPLWFNLSIQFFEKTQYFYLISGTGCTATEKINHTAISVAITRSDSAARLRRRRSGALGVPGVIAPSHAVEVIVNGIGSHFTNHFEWHFNQKSCTVLLIQKSACN